MMLKGAKRNPTIMTLTRKPKPYEYRLDPIKVYLDDIEYIVQVLEGAGASVKLDSRDFVIGNVADLRDQKNIERVSNLTISFENPDGEIFLGSDRATLSLSEDSPSSRALIDHIKESLLKTKRFFATLLSRLIYFPISVYFTEKAFEHSIIILKYRRDEPPFLKRNLDSIILSIIFTIVGAVLGWFLAVLTGCS